VSCEQDEGDGSSATSNIEYSTARVEILLAVGLDEPFAEDLSPS